MKNSQNSKNKLAQYGGDKKGAKNPSEIFYRTSLNLFSLLAHHPYFLEKIETLRNKYKISPEQIQDIQGILVWKLDNRNLYNNIISDPDYYNLYQEFDYPKEFAKSVQEFIFDYLLTSKSNLPSSIGTGLNIIKPQTENETLGLNLGSIYLEIAPFTTLNEIEENWYKINKNQDGNRKFGVPDINKFDEYVWELLGLKDLKASDEKTIKMVKNKFSKSKLTYTDLLKAKSRYKKNLVKLRKF